jgi:putative flippase GtrA
MEALFGKFSPTAQVLRFVIVGLASTALFAVLYDALRSELAPQAANVLALVATNVLNTAANRAFTFGVPSREGFVRDQLAGMGALGVAVAITMCAIGILRFVEPHASVTVELVVLTAASVVATIARFYLLRFWFERHERITLTRAGARMSTRYPPRAAPYATCRPSSTS